MTENIMPKRRERNRRKRHDYSLIDFLMCLLAVIIFTGAIYYFFVMDQKKEQVTEVKSQEQKANSSKINSSKICTKKRKEVVQNDTQKDDDNENKDSKYVKSETVNAKISVGEPAKNGVGSVVAEEKTENQIDESINEDENSEQADMFEYGELPVFFSVIKAGTVQLLETIIEKKTVNINETSSNGFNALHYAAVLMKVDMMRLLLDYNLFKATDKINSGKYVGNTALHWVCLAAGRYPHRAIEAVELLLSHGAEIKAKDGNGFIPIFSAVQSGNIELVEFLKSKGENVNSKRIHKESIKEGDVDSEKVRYDSLLHFAMRICNRPMIKYLIGNGADIHAVNGFNMEPIHEAAAMGCVDGLKELILVQKVSKQQKSPSRADKYYIEDCEEDWLYGASPLHYAAFYDQIKAVEFLFLIQADFDALDEERLKAVAYAEMTANVDLKKYFYDRYEFELELEEVYEGKVPDVEAKVRKLENPNCIDAEAKYKLYVEEYLHVPKKNNRCNY